MVARDLVLLGLLQGVGLMCAGDESCDEQDLTSFVQMSVQVHKALAASHRRPPLPPDAMAQAVIRAAIHMKERVPPVVQHKSAIILLNVGKYSRKLCEDSHGMFMVILMSAVFLMLAWLVVTIFRSKYSQETPRERYDGLFRTDHIHWKEPVASLGSASQKPPPFLPRLPMPHDSSSPYQAYSPYESSISSVTNTAASLYSRPNSGVPHAVISSSQLPVGSSASAQVPRGVAHHDISTARDQHAGLSTDAGLSPEASKYYDSFVSLSSGSGLPSSQRISLVTRGR